MNVNGGSLKVRGLKSETRIDSRNAEVEVTMAAPAPVAIYSDGERVSLTPPPGGYTLDARVTDGRVTPDDFIESMGFTSTKASDSQEARCSGPSRAADRQSASAPPTPTSPSARQTTNQKTDEKPAPEKLEKELKGR